MTKYLLKRILHGLVSIVIVVALVMIMIYTMLDRNLVFAGDTKYSHTSNNARVVYKYSKWEDYGYLDYITYSDWLNELVSSGELTEEERSAVVGFGRTKAQDSEQVSKYVKKFTKYYKSQGYTVVRKEAVMMNKKKYADGGQQQLFAYKDIPLTTRMANYFSNLITFDHINNVEDIVGERGLTFTLHDPVYGGEKFSPAIIGNGRSEEHTSELQSHLKWYNTQVFTLL